MIHSLKNVFNAQDHTQTPLITEDMEVCNEALGSRLSETAHGADLDGRSNYSNGNSVWTAVETGSKKG